jgi:hypothetical protein
MSAQVNDRQHVIQKFTGSTHKGLALQILLLTGAFTNEHNIRISGAYTKHYIGTGLTEFTFGAAHTLLRKSFPIQHLNGSFFDIFCAA